MPGRRRPAEGQLRLAIRGILRASTLPGAKLAELMNLGHDEPFGLTWAGLRVPDRCVYAVIAKRRREPDLGERTVIMRARAEDGEELTDREIRDELMTLGLPATTVEPERPRHRNVTMIPASGGRVLVRERRSS